MNISVVQNDYSSFLSFLSFLYFFLYLFSLTHSFFNRPSYVPYICMQFLRYTRLIWKKTTRKLTKQRKKTEDQTFFLLPFGMRWENIKFVSKRKIISMYFSFFFLSLFRVLLNFVAISHLFLYLYIYLFVFLLQFCWFFSRS